MDTGQTEDDIFISLPSDHELNDSEQLTGESLQPYLTMINQLQWLVTLGDLPHINKSLPCPSSGQLQGNYKGPMAMSKGPLTFIRPSLHTISVKC